MARAALTKLFVLVILAFIICLPEFFSLYRVSKVNFLCQPYRPCERGNQEKKGGYKDMGDADTNGKDMCDPPQTPEHEKWERACTQDNRSNGMDPVLNPRGDAWFVCRTNTDMEVLHKNMSSSDLTVYLEVSVELQRDEAHTQSLTLFGRTNYSSLYPYLPEDEDEQNGTGSEGQTEAFYCCLPAPPTSESANQSRCLLWVANQTVLTAQEKLPWKRTKKGEWQCVYRGLWLALVCLIFLTIVTIVIREIFWQNRSFKNPKVQPVDYTMAGQQFNDGDRQTELPLKGTIPGSCDSQHWSGLSTIPESEIQEDIEMLLDGNLNNCYTAKLHHRGHPSTSSLSEEQVW